MLLFDSARLAMGGKAATLSTESLAAWSEGLVRVMESFGNESTPKRLCRAISQLVPVDFSSVFVLRRESAPIEILDDIPNGAEPVAYLESPYLLDPVYDSFLKGTLPECGLLEDYLPDNFFESDYFLKYWSSINVVSEFSFNAAYDDDTVIHVPVSRVKGSPAFSGPELAIFTAIAPIVNATMVRYWDTQRDTLSKTTASADSFHRRLKYVLDNFGSSILTPREQEIVLLTMRGYSDKLAARELDIAPGTVRNHKKNIFNKLQVTSQGQVFGLFLDVLQLPVNVEDRTDPLTALREHAVER